MSTRTEMATARANGLGEVLRRSAARFRDRTAIIDGETRLSYREFDDLVTRVAAGLAGHDINPGDRVALLSRNSADFAAIAWGAARLGVILVPINFMLTADEVGYIVGHSEPVAFIAQPEFVATATEAIAASGQAVPTLITTGDAKGEWAPFADLAATDATGWTPPIVADDDPIRLMYTSGTESRPKGALLTSRALQAEYLSTIVDGGMSGEDIDLHTLPLYHCAQLDCFLGPDLMLGATSIILPAPEPARVLASIAEHKVTKYFAPPTVWISLLRHPDFDTTDLSSLRKGYYGASPMPVEILTEIQQRLPDVDLWNFYGQTELAPVATILPPHEQLTHAGSAGFPVLNVQTRLVDDEDAEVPVGEIGEVVHRSPHIAAGYWRDGEKTAEAFRGGWFHSGDLAIEDEDGRITIVDRKKDMIKSGGENVASREVEEAIYSHPDVAEVAVFALPDPRWVEAVTATVVAKGGSDLTSAAIQEHCAGVLAPFKQPKRIEIVTELPKNPSGKILKRELRERFS
ncbi:fatty acyl-CoA synthetase [Janibacter cremeus]|uniref:Fatty-acyl-CoA synthase n=1 Tax=Janibacter cremeus TaxID=1285192 RepID=A0A852VLR4_9MICO|nr:fatty acyl-CoA synthetase [Janibacter cremeus]NYF98017.1 fatty-acyl-CoA synthase [Janibacter cremeus]